MTLQFDGWPKKIDNLFYATSNFVHDFKSINEFKLELQSRNSQFGSKLVIILSRVTLKFDGWPKKMIGHLFYTTSSFLYYFKYIGEFKLKLQSGKAQFGWKSTIFFSRVTFKLDRWPWKTNGLLFCDNFSFVHHFNAISKFKLKLQSGNSQFASKSTIIFSCVTLKFYRLPWKTIGHLFYATSSFVHYFVPIGEFKLELQSGNAQFGSNSKIFLALWPWNFTEDLEKQKGTSPMLLQALCIIS